MHRINQIKYVNKIILLLLLVSSFMAFTAEASGRFNTQKRYLYVQPGQNIFNIVKVLYPGQQDKWPAIIKNIVRKNPHAFIGADATRIQAGARLELPPLSARFNPGASGGTMVYKGPKAVGQVVKSRGKTFVLSKRKNKRNLDIGSEVYVGDRIYTGVKGFVRLSMIDDAKIDIRCNSEMLIEDYQLLKGANRSVLHLIKGSVNKITGSIGKVAEDIYEMHTPLATVGVRGTEYAIRVLQSYGCDGSFDVNSKGMFVKVNKGRINIQSKQQQQELQKGQAAHLASADDKLKRIEAQDGVFSAAGSEKKSYFFGSMVWLLLVIPLLLLLRRRRNGI